MILLEGDDYTGRSVNLAARLAGAAQAARAARDGRARLVRTRRHTDRARGDDHGRRASTSRSRSSVSVAPPPAIPFAHDRVRNRRVHARRPCRVVAAEPPRQAQLVHDPDVAGAARARQGAARRSRSARARRDRQRPRVLVGHRHVGVHRRFDGRDRRRRRRRHASPRSRRSTASCARRRRTRGWRKRVTRRSPRCAGFALGAGLQMALACDIRVFARGTSVGLLEHKYGILPDLGGTQRLPRVVGAGKAKEMIWTAARIDADEAYRIGLCERLVDDDALDADVDRARGRPSPRNRRSRCRARSGRSKRPDACPSPKGSSSRPRPRRSACARPTCAKRSPRSSSNANPTTRVSSLFRRDSIPSPRERAARRARAAVGRDEERGPEADGGRAARAGRHHACATCRRCATST